MKSIIWGLVAIFGIIMLGATVIVTIVLQNGASVLPFMNHSTITVSGMASSQQASQFAEFSAGVTAINDDKQIAIDEVNQKAEDLIAAVKNFGIEDENIKTENLSVYQMEEPIFEEGLPRKTQQGQWRVTNQIKINLKNIDQASELATLLTNSGATNVYGPNFRTEDTREAEADLLDDAVANAKTKAEKVAQAQGRKLGKVVAIVEGGTTSPGIPRMAMAEGLGGGGAPVEPGSQKITQTVTVTFEMR